MVGSPRDKTERRCPLQAGCTWPMLLPKCMPFPAKSVTRAMGMTQAWAGDACQVVDAHQEGGNQSGTVTIAGLTLCKKCNKGARGQDRLHLILPDLSWKSQSQPLLSSCLCHASHAPEAFRDIIAHVHAGRVFRYQQGQQGAVCRSQGNEQQEAVRAVDESVSCGSSFSAEREGSDIRGGNGIAWARRLRLSAPG